MDLFYERNLYSSTATVPETLRHQLSEVSAGFHNRHFYSAPIAAIGVVALLRRSDSCEIQLRIDLLPSMFKLPTVYVLCTYCCLSLHSLFCRQ